MSDDTMRFTYSDAIAVFLADAGEEADSVAQGWLESLENETTVTDGFGG